MLIHNDKNAGVVATDAKYMSSAWKSTREIAVNNAARVQEAMNVASSSGWSNIAGSTGWLKSGMCTGSARKIESMLSKPK